MLTPYKLSKFRISIAHLWPLTVIIGIFVFVNTHPIRPHDFWWHIAIGREILSTEQIPQVDGYSFTAAGSPYPSYQIYWIAEIIWYLLYDFGGPALVVFAQSIVVTTAYALILYLAYQDSRDWRLAALVALFAAALGISDWNVRPQSLILWLLPLFLVILRVRSDKANDRWLVAIPLGMVLWSNCHGSYIIGLATLGIWLVDGFWSAFIQPGARREGDRHIAVYVITFITALLASLLNPRGLGVLRYVQELTTDPVVQSLVTEWAPPTFDELHGALFLFGLLATAGILMLSPKRPNPFQLLSFLAFAMLGLRTKRGVIWFGMVVAPILADHLAALKGTLARRGLLSANASPGSPVINTLLASALLLAAVVTLPWFKEALPLPPEKAGLISDETPVQATRYLLETRPPGRLFHTAPFGSYLIWAAQPTYPVFVDPRIELYPAEIWTDYLSISAAACGWQDRLRAYDVNTLMLNPVEQPNLVAQAQSLSEWQSIYADSTAVIFVRADEQ